MTFEERQMLEKKGVAAVLFILFGQLIDRSELMLNSRVLKLNYLALS